jgi:pectate lyase
VKNKKRAALTAVVLAGISTVVGVTMMPSDAATTLAAPTWSSKADGFAQGTTGGAGGTTVTVKTYADLNKYATASAAYVIKVSGTITYPTLGYEIKVASNKTILGLGTTGRISKGGFFLGTGVKNVIIRNLTIGDTAVASDDPDDKDFDYDGIQMDTASNVWIDHNTFANINDGYIDSRKDTTNVTISWNKMGNHNKTLGIGWTTNVTARETLHHNYIYNSNQRNPSADNLQYAHLYNNYLSNVTSYGNYSRGSTKMVVENSYFEKVKNPLQRDSTAQLKQSGSTFVSCTGTQSTSGSAFTPSSFYSYTLDKAADVPNLVKTYGGPQASIGV